jgi:hypothetical protein
MHLRLLQRFNTLLQRCCMELPSVKRFLFHCCDCSRVCFPLKLNRCSQSPEDDVNVRIATLAHWHAASIQKSKLKRYARNLLFLFEKLLFALQVLQCLWG